MSENEIDMLLAIIGNPTRRQILRKLVKEEHYPLQLSRELRVSQQAIMKHLDVLEKNDLVRSDYQKSESGGPRRKYYEATRSFTIVIDLGPELFNEELRVHDKPMVIEAADDVSSLSEAENLRVKLAEYSQSISLINSRLAEISTQRDELLVRKKEAMHRVNQIIDTLCDDYIERKILRHLITEDDISIPTMSERLNMRESVIEEMLKKLEEEGLLIVNK